MKNPMKHYSQTDPKYASRVFQQVYFTNKHMTPADRDRVATEAYDRAMARGRVAAQAVRERGGSEFEAAIEQIRATFDNELRTDTLTALKLSAAIASGRIPTMEEVADVVRPKGVAS